MNLYIDYSEFELTCWNTDGKGTNVAMFYKNVIYN